MKNVQITVDEETLARVEKVGQPLGLTRSEIVRQALRQWLRTHTADRFEREWIDALGAKPDDPARADDWLDIQAWDRR